MPETLSKSQSEEMSATDLAKLMEESGCKTAADFADKIGYHRSAVWRWFTGRSRITSHTARRIRTALKTR